MRTYFALTVVLMAGLFAVSGFGQSPAVRNEAMRISGDTFNFTARTANGANVYGAVQPSASMMQAIDTGLTQLFAVARKNGYRRKLNYSDYNIYIAKADRTKNPDGKYSADIAIGSAQYAGTQYDKGGYMYVAGIVVSLNPMAFMVADHTQDLASVSEAVRNEGEHLVLYANDRPRFDATRDHSRGGGHPILQ